jgi:hypothetical protein
VVVVEHFDHDAVEAAELRRATRPAPAQGWGRLRWGTSR